LITLCKRKTADEVHKTRITDLDLPTDDATDEWLLQ